ncbi:MAG: branched-chain amino acid transaminase [Deltaproteobacteria bacterium]|nr:branched-chain amino acid transaminase [Deltaproteobacteria bacterium]
MPDKLPIWLDGEIVPYENATTHMLSHTLHYGLGVFEGIRAYQGKDGRTAVFRLQEHVKRLFDSCKIATIKVPYSEAQISDAIRTLLRNNKLADCYIRPLVWLGEGTIKVAASDNVVRVAIAAWPWGAYLGDEALEQGVRVCVSSYTRIGIRANYEKAKICGQYVNSVLAKREAMANGYHEAILLDQQGFVAEGTGENIFLVRDGVIYTPDRGASLLAGITRESLLDLARDAGIEVREQALTRSELYLADEVFLCGTAAEVTPVREIDGRIVGTGRRGPITERIQKDYFAAVRGENARREGWLAYV